ncbi:MAG: hypothetical protein ACYC8V_14405 [Caulobacteraceae bacterium]
MTPKTRLVSAEPLPRRLQEAFAQALARGLEARAAAKAAGYRKTRAARRLQRDPAIAARVVTLKADLAGGGSRDTRAQIEELIAICADARALGDPRGLAIARACIVDAAKLKLLLPAEAPSPSQGAVIAELDREMSDEEWNSRFGPEAPGGKIGDVEPR